MKDLYKHTQWGFFSYSMACVDCNHVTGDIIHDRCRTHAFCSREGRYYAAICATCEDLWYRAADLDNPRDSKMALDYLKSWIGGFRKNSRSRPRGQSHFFDEQERLEYQELLARHGGRRSSSVSSSFSSGHEVRILTMDVLIGVCLKYMDVGSRLCIFQ